jgi:5-methylcytosine-specific restriction endonuclease McrA
MASKEIVIQRIECELSLYSGGEYTCQWCAVELIVGGKRTVWCSSKCRLTWERNHLWNRARSAARRRDKYACKVCGKSKAEGHKIEVNHIEPLVGRGYHYGCVHHQNNLETLCKEHHQEKTNEQRQNRKSS